MVQKESETPCRLVAEVGIPWNAYFSTLARAISIQVVLALSLVSR